MGPTVFQIGSYRFYFFLKGRGTYAYSYCFSKWGSEILDRTTISLAAYSGLSKTQLNKLQKLVEEHKGEITKAWQKHFKA